MNGSVIYDFGMNNGDDVEYYLLKGLKVVGVEANPALCRMVEQRFADEIADGRLVVINAALSIGESGQPLAFYVHKANHVLSQLDIPDAEDIDEFERVEVTSLRASEVILNHGTPCFIKIDLEGLDARVLREIFEAGIHPPEISAESHSVAVFACLVDAGYRAFNLVDGWSVAEKYGDALIETPGGPRKFAFRAHSAGPFGVDIRSEWQDPDTFFYTLAAAGLGWKDIHASDLIRPAPAPSYSGRIRRQAAALGRQVVRDIGSHLTSRK